VFSDVLNKGQTEQRRSCAVGNSSDMNEDGYLRTIFPDIPLLHTKTIGLLEGHSLEQAPILWTVIGMGYVEKGQLLKLLFRVTCDPFIGWVCGDEPAVQIIHADSKWRLLNRET